MGKLEFVSIKISLGDQSRILTFEDEFGLLKKGMSFFVYEILRGSKSSYS